MIASRPKLETTNENNVNATAHCFIDQNFGNILLNISEQLTIKATEVLKQARVTVVSKIYIPNFPK